MSCVQRVVALSFLPSPRYYEHYVERYVVRLSLIHILTDVVLASLDAEFDKLYKDSGRPSIAPEYILRALLLQVFYSVRSERLLVEQIDYNLLFRWFVGLGMAVSYTHLDFLEGALTKAGLLSVKR